jgi:hypothetical protein
MACSGTAFFFTTLKYKAIVVGSLLLCKMQFVPLVVVPSFLKTDGNQTVTPLNKGLPRDRRSVYTAMAPSGAPRGWRLRAQTCLQNL